MNTQEIRTLWLKFFASKGHHIEPSASLVPHDDPSLLWINAGMAPLKPYFDGRVVPPFRRIANAQKCIRTNDIENVGLTTRHLTFFEMLGNFSLADYFKKEAIVWAWEFLTGQQWLAIPSEKLSVTVHPEDEEAVVVWRDVVGLPEQRIVRCAENFWDLGEGPCGPCSEIFYDRGLALGDDRCVPGGDNERYLEIWNLVFTQFNHLSSGEIVPLPAKNIDTGAGLERLASVMQGVDSAFETDGLVAIVEHVQRQVRFVGAQAQEAKQQMALRCIADHTRTLVFALADGVLPSNEGRGYIIRRLLRRAVRWGKTALGIDEPFLYTLVSTVVAKMGDAYPELMTQAHAISDTIRAEEIRFHATLSDGLALVERMVEQAHKEQRDALTGEEAFKLYDTYGFPLDLTVEYVTEQGLTVDVVSFEAHMEAQRTRARTARQEAMGMQVQSDAWMNCTQASTFVGYDSFEIVTHIVEWQPDGDGVQLVLAHTPFYLESGGQASDTGTIRWESSGEECPVQRVWRAPHGQTVHEILRPSHEVQQGQRVRVMIDANARRATMRNHAATHLLHEALRTIVGDHVRQAGSSVQRDRLRFDFVCPQPLGAELLTAVERRVNTHIWDSLPITTEEMSKERAMQTGAVALFGEKYGDVVRVVRMGSVSTELCGGTHVSNTGHIGSFHIVSETGIGSGVRRIEAVTGEAAYDWIKQVETMRNQCASLLKVTPEQMVAKVETMLQQVKVLTKELEDVRQQQVLLEADEWAKMVTHVGAVPVVSAQLEESYQPYMKAIADRIRDRCTSVVVVLGIAGVEKAFLLVAMTPDWVASGLHAGRLVQQMAAVCNGSGGGRADLAQAGGKDPHAVPQALGLARSNLETQQPSISQRT